MMIKFTRPATDRNGKHYPEQPMLVGTNYFIEANESINQQTGDTEVWVKVWDTNQASAGPKSYKAKETWSEFCAKNGMAL